MMRVLCRNELSDFDRLCAFVFASLLALSNMPDSMRLLGRMGNICTQGRQSVP
jgi:hypothetical protein